MNQSSLIISLFFISLQDRGEDKTVFEIETDKLNQLPIVDFAPRDWTQDAEFGFEAGPLCFR
jgi:collagen type V/XI/XXIV/XXVII alpha